MNAVLICWGVSPQGSEPACQGWRNPTSRSSATSMSSMPRGPWPQGMTLFSSGQPIASVCCLWAAIEITLISCINALSTWGSEPHA